MELIDFEFRQRCKSMREEISFLRLLKNNITDANLQSRDLPVLNELNAQLCNLSVLMSKQIAAAEVLNNENLGVTAESDLALAKEALDEVYDFLDLMTWLCSTSANETSRRLSGPVD